MARSNVILTETTQVGFKIFLNITPTVTNWTSDSNQFSLIFDENPLADFVELPDDGRAQDELWFSNILCGVLRGSLEMVYLPPSSPSFLFFSFFLFSFFSGGQRIDG